MIYAANKQECVGWVSDSVTQHINPAHVGLRLLPNPTYEVKS
jgi:hypothetical protein